MSGLHVWNQQCFSTKMAFYDGRLKNYLVLCAKRERGLNHSGGDAEGESFHIELQVRAKFLGKGGGVLRISVDGDDRMGAKIKTQKNPQGFQQN